MDDLLHKIDQVYQLLIEDTALIATTSRKGTITQFAEAMNACSQFIRTYSEITSICMVDRLFMYPPAHWLTQGGDSERMSRLKQA